MTFELDPQLAQDGILLGETNAYIINLVNDQRYPWVVLIPKVANRSEVYQLTPQQQQDLSRCSIQLGAELMDIFAGTKLNTAAIGNIVSQLHLHHIVRFENDECWPEPVWGRGEAKPYENAARQERVALLQRSLTVLKQAN